MKATSFVDATDDVLEGENIEESVACSNSYGWDFPDCKESNYQIKSGKKIQKGFIYIPYSSLLPDPVNNLIVAGRCLSVEKELFEPVRVMGSCVGMGQAAGLVSVLTLEREIDYRDININDLQKYLKADK